MANVTKMIAVSYLFLADNVRTTACEKIPEMVASLRRNGFKPNHPVVLSQRDNDADGKPRFLVLCGNRRTKALLWLQENDADEYNRIVPTGKIPAIIHKGLTEEEEILLRIDHSKDEDRVALDEWSIFLAIKQLVRAFTSESQEKIAEKLGIFYTKGKNAGKPNRSYVQTRVDLARLPEYVQDEFQKLMVSGKDETPVRIADIKTLKTIYNEEFVAFPNADGPKFTAAWDAIVNPEPQDADEETAKDDPKSLKPQDAKNAAQNASSAFLKRVLLAATRQGGSLGELDAQASQFEIDAEILADIRAFLPDGEYGELVANARNARLAREAQEAETQEADAETVNAS